MSELKDLAKELCKEHCHHLCQDTKDCVVEDEAKELFKQALVEGVNRHIDKTIEEAKKIEEIANDINMHCCSLAEQFCGETSCNACLTNFLYNAGYRKQSEIVRCEDCQNSEVCPDTLLWCNELERLTSPKGFCHRGAKMEGENK